jgi:hypothetical protein
MRIPLLAFVLICAAPAALANDTSAELASGGLVFVANADIEMRSEKLFISAKQVRVTYEFFNKADHDVTVTVAFPLPEIRVANQDENIAVPTQDPVNIFGFATTVDGQPVKTEIEQHVTQKGVDRTRYLRGLGIPLPPYLEATSKAVDALPKNKWNEFISFGLGEIDEYDAGKGMEKHLAPRWGLATTYYWKQTFPAKKTTVIVHQYKPSVGGSVQTSLGSPQSAKEAWYRDYVKKYCIDSQLTSAIDNLRRASKSEFGAPLNEQRIDYILKTGANWSGPIASFELTVDKGAPDSLLSVCGQGLKKISPTQFQLQRSNFKPDGNLSVLILNKMPK